MVFLANSAFCLALIALAAGFVLLAKSVEDNPMKKVLKIVGYIVVVGAILSLLCTIVNSFCIKKNLTTPCPMMLNMKPPQQGQPIEKAPSK